MRARVCMPAHGVMLLRYTACAAQTQHNVLDTQANCFVCALVLLCSTEINDHRGAGKKVRNREVAANDGSEHHVIPSPQRSLHICMPKLAFYVLPGVVAMHWF